MPVFSQPTSPQVGSAIPVDEAALVVEAEVLCTWTTLVGLDCVDDVFELVALDGALVIVAVVVFTELVELVFVLVLVLVLLAFVLLDVVDFTVLVGSATDFVVYGTTVVFTGTVEVTVLVVLMKHDLPIDSAQLVLLIVVVVSRSSLDSELADHTVVSRGQYPRKTHKRSKCYTA